MELVEADRREAHRRSEPPWILIAVALSVIVWAVVVVVIVGWLG